MGQRNDTSSAASPSLAAWQARAVHTLTGYSGQQFKIRLRGIGTLLEFGDLPDDLFDIATADLTDTIVRDGIDGDPVVISGAVQWVAKVEDQEQKRERIRTFGSYQRHLVAACLVEPALTYDEITDAVRDGTLPEDDLAMVAEIVQRLRYRDAKGVRIGVEPLDRWATFREGHKGVACTGDEDCPGCAHVQDAFSSIDLGDL